MKRVLFFTTMTSIFFLLTGPGAAPARAQIMDLIRSASKNCAVDTRYAFVKDCTGDEAAKIETELKQKGVTASLGNFAAALNDKDDKIKAVACKFIYRQYRDNIGELDKNRASIPVAVVEQFLRGLAGTKSYVAFYAVEVAVHLSMMKGMEAKLYKVLSGHPESVVTLEGYRHLMRFGRIRVFGKVQELAKNADPKISLAALEAPNNMYKMDDAEKAQVCPWAKGFLSSAEGNMSLAAGKTMNQCGGTYIDALLTEAEKRAGEGKLGAPFSGALTSFTFSCTPMFGSPPAGTKEQCDRREALVKLLKK